MTFAAGYFLSQYQRDNTKLPIAEKHTPASIETPASKTEVRKVEKTYPVEQVTSTSEEKDKKQVDTHVKQPAVTTKEDVKSDPIPETILPEEDVALDLLPALDGKVSDELIEDMAETIKEPLYGEKEIFDRIEYDAHYIRDLLDQEEYTDVLAQKEKNLPQETGVLALGLLRFIPIVCLAQILQVNRTNHTSTMLKIA